MKIKLVGESYALLSGRSDPGENGYLSLRVSGEEKVGALSVNGRAFPATGEVFRVPVTAFAVGENRIALRLTDGRAVPSEGIRLTGGLFSPAGAKTEEIVAACDKRFASLSASLAGLAARVKALEDESGILP